jgi:hypothetical protein
MVLEKWISDQRIRGNEREANRAEIIRKKHLGEFLFSGESLRKINRFSMEQRRLLENKEFTILTLTGLSVRDLRERGMIDHSSDWLKDFETVDNLGSRLSQVAINTSELFLPGSNNLTYPQQNDMVARYSKELEVEIPNVEAIIGNAPDYVELAIKFFFLYERHLFENAGNSSFSRTNNLVNYPEYAAVGKFIGDLDLRVVKADIYSASSDLHAFPLIVPRVKQFTP